MRNHSVREAVWQSLIALAVFLMVGVVMVTAVNNAAAGGEAEELKTAERSLERAAVLCYVAEGCYPMTYEYLKDHYGVRIDEEKFAVDYRSFASNVMPDITVLRRDE